MKRIFLLLICFLLLMSCFLLIGCNGELGTDSRINTDGKNAAITVELTKGNFSTYVASNSSSSFSTNTHNYMTYYTAFTGTRFCKFVDCVITCKYVYGDASSEEYAVKLNLSGDGEVPPFHRRLANDYWHFQLVIISVNGTVEIL